MTTCDTLRRDDAPISTGALTFLILGCLTMGIWLVTLLPVLNMSAHAARRPHQAFAAGSARETEMHDFVFARRAD